MTTRRFSGCKVEYVNSGKEREATRNPEREERGSVHQLCNRLCNFRRAELGTCFALAFVFSLSDLLAVCFFTLVCMSGLVRARFARLPLASSRRLRPFSSSSPIFAPDLNIPESSESPHQRSTAFDTLIASLLTVGVLGLGGVGYVF
jgi:hypothetical protein